MTVKKKISTGAYLLHNPDNKTQFGMVGASVYVDENIPNVQFILGKQLRNKVVMNEDGDLTINLSMTECSKLAETLKIVENSMELLMILAKRGKLTDEAYLKEEE